MKTPSKELIEATEAVFLAMAYTQTVRPIILKEQRKVIELLKPIDKFTGKVITKPEDSYKMKDGTFQVYLDLMHIIHSKIGFPTEREYCPLLIAENLERKAKRRLIVLSKELHNILNPEDLFASPDLYEKYLDLTLRYLVKFINPKFAESHKNYKVIF